MAGTAAFGEEAGGRLLTPYCGVAVADFGGADKGGFLVGCQIGTRTQSTALGYEFGIEAMNVKNEGRVIHRSSATGELLYDGPGTASLTYLNLANVLRYRYKVNSVVAAPYASATVGLLLSQYVEIPQPEIGAFAGFGEYRIVNIGVCGGMRVEYRTVFLDVRHDWGLSTLIETSEFAGAGGGETFTRSGGRIGIWSVSAGFRVGM